MKTEHPITPPPELVKQWLSEEYERGLTADHVATQAARWGADQELEACVEWLVVDDWKNVSENLRAFRRPKPPSLKEQAIELVDRIEKAESVWAMSELDIIRRALEALPE